jgi:hypothetical protein
MSVSQDHHPEQDRLNAAQSNAGAIDLQSQLEYSLVVPLCVNVDSSELLRSLLIGRCYWL